MEVNKVAREQFCAIVMQLRFGVSGITHPKTEIWLHLFKRNRAQASVGNLKKMTDCSYNDFPAALGITGHGNISFILMGFYSNCLTRY